MSDFPDEMIEKAAKASADFAAHRWAGVAWDDLGPAMQEDYRAEARAVLDAVADRARHGIEPDVTAEPLAATSTPTSTNVLDNALAAVAESDPALAAVLRREVDDLRDGRTFGLVFNRHLPESVRLPNHPVRRGVKVALRNPQTASKTERDATWRVTKVETADGHRVAWLHGIDTPRLVDDLVVIRDFGEPVYPGLKPVERIERGGDAPFHTVINGENYHALQALRMTHRGAVDLIYIDPPYNTGNQGWIYNDKYVDVTKGDASSKWLSFMERRLLIARELLKDTGVIIVAIGDDEHHRLRMLMDQVFGPQNFISNLVWQGGRKNDSRYVSNGADYMLVYARDEEAMQGQGVRWREEKGGIDEILGAGAVSWLDALCYEFFLAMREDVADGVAEVDAQSAPPSDDSDAFARLAKSAIASEENAWREVYAKHYADAMRDPSRPMDDKGRTLADFIAEALDHRSYGESVRRRAAARATAAMKAWFKALPSDHPAQGSKHYNHVCERTGKVFFPDNISWPGGGGPRYEVLHPITGRPVPVPSRGWVLQKERMAEEIAAGRIYFGPDHRRGINRKSYLEAVSTQVSESVFYRDRRASNKHLQSVLGDKRFPFPKDHEVLMRWFRMAAPSDAVILDFFGGSGTTAEAVMRLNAEDGGTRQAILVTNNELGVKDAKALAKDGYAPGDPEWEAKGVFEYVTRPRILTVVTGIRPDGSTYSDGLAANAEFFEMTYLDETRVSRAREFEAIAPLLWMQTGANGERIATEPDTGWALTEHYGVLFTEDATRPFLKALNERSLAAEPGSAPTHVFVVTDSDAHYTDIAGRLPSGTKAVRLYESYLKNFEINVEVGQ